MLAALAPNATWTEAAGFPYAGTYTGPEEIIANVFKRLATEWVGYKAEVHTYLAEYVDSAMVQQAMTTAQ